MAVSVVQVLVWWMLLTEEAKESLGVFGKVSECAGCKSWGSPEGSGSWQFGGRESLDEGGDGGIKWL